MTDHHFPDVFAEFGPSEEAKGRMLSEIFAAAPKEIFGDDSAADGHPGLIVDDSVLGSQASKGNLSSGVNDSLVKQKSSGHARKRSGVVLRIVLPLAACFALVVLLNVTVIPQIVTQTSGDSRALQVYSTAAPQNELAAMAPEEGNASQKERAETFGAAAPQPDTFDAVVTADSSSSQFALWIGLAVAVTFVLILSAILLVLFLLRQYQIKAPR